MSAAPEVVNPQNVNEISQCWRGVHIGRKDSGKGPLPAKLLSGDASSSSDELNTKVRKPYTITKQRERWTETEHEKFLEALRLYGRAWRRIEEYIGTKTAVQIRSHAQKFFHKLEREASCRSSDGKLPDIAIPPPRPKRKPNHPYPKKAGSSPPVLEDESKETLLLSSAGVSAAHSDSCQFGSFDPSMNQGLGAIGESPVASRHFFGPQGSVKIFGKTVSISKTNKAGFHDCASTNCLVSENKDDPAKQSAVAEPKQIVGFSPFVKLKNLRGDSSSKAPAHSDRDCSYSGAIQCEGMGESIGRTNGHDLAGVITEAVTPCDGDCKISGDPGHGKVETGSVAAGLKGGEKGDVQFSQPMIPAVHNWRNNFFHFQSGVSISSIPGSAVVDGPTNSSSSYWQFIQASAVNYAAYTAAMVAVAGWKAANSGCTVSAEFAKGDTNEFQLPFVPSPWWSCNRFIPPVNFPLSMDAPSQGVDLDTSKTVKLLSSERKLESLQETSSQKGEPFTGLRGAEVAEICEPALNVSAVTDDELKDCRKANCCTQVGSQFQRSCLTEASGAASVFPAYNSQLDAEEVFVPVKVSAQGSDTETRARPVSFKNAYSSSDEFEEEGDKQGEGSSSGSNIPASKCQSSEGDAPHIVESKKRDCCAVSVDNGDSWNRGLQTLNQHCVTNTAELPKLRLKHAEKSRKHQQRDSWHGEDSKRLKSCVHEMELRKEVSQEGRKAFQALFTSKLLPQTFASAGERDLPGKDEHLSRPIVSKDESRLNECIKFRVPPENVNRAGNVSNNVATWELINEFQGLDGHSEVTSKGFSVSSSSGFVPYRRLSCSEPLTTA